MAVFHASVVWRRIKIAIEGKKKKTETPEASGNKESKKAKGIVLQNRQKTDSFYML